VFLFGVLTGVLMSLAYWLVARDLNRKAILIELNAEYIKIAKERLRLNEQLGAFA
jgi:DNA modification methylase